MADESIFQHDGKPKQPDTATDAIIQHGLKERDNIPMTSYELGLRRVLSQAIWVMITKNQIYGDSWKKRGGVGAFMMLARKWDRIEIQVAKSAYDVFKACEGEIGKVDGLLDDICDLRNYLTLVEQEVRNLYGDVQGRRSNAEQRPSADNSSVRVDDPEHHEDVHPGGKTR